MILFKMRCGIGSQCNTSHIFCDFYRISTRLLCYISGPYMNYSLSSYMVCLRVCVCRMHRCPGMLFSSHLRPVAKCLPGFLRSSEGQEVSANDAGKADDL